MQSLFDRLGGAAPVHAVTTQFYANIHADAEVAGFFKDVQMDAQINKTSSFLCAAMGGPAYAGRDMTEVHKNLGINNAHFDRVIGHLKSALTGAGVSAEVTAEVLAVAETTRPTVVFA